jgi:hypothetical protein
MDWPQKEDFLKLAEAHIALGERHIQKQLLLIASLERDGLDTTQEREFLKTLHEATATIHLGAGIE